MIDLKKAKKRFIEIANKTGIHGDNIKQEPNLQERDELWDITRVFLNRIYILDEIDDLSEEDLNEYNDLCYWSISALHWNDSLENYTFDNGRHRRDTLTLALCLYARVNRDYKVYENIKENFVIPHAFGSILLWVSNEITTVGRDIYFEKFDLEFIKLANEQKKAFFIEYGYYNRGDKELEQDKIEKIALEIYNILNQKGNKNLPQFLLKYIRNDKGLIAEDLEKNTKYLESILSSSTKTKSQVKVTMEMIQQGFDGRGLFQAPDGAIYEGEFKDGKFSGKGKLIWPDGENYDGEWKDGNPNGKGIYNFTNGDVYYGEFKNGEKSGSGEFTHGPGDWEGDIYEGEWKNDQRSGHGVITFGSGEFKGEKYDGQWKDGKRNGKGTYHFADGTSFMGTWEDGDLIEKEGEVKVSEGEPTKSAIHKFGFLLCSFATTTDNKFSKEEMAKVVEILKSTGADEKIGLEIFDWFNEEMGKVNWKFDDKAFKKVLLDCIQDVGNFLNQFDEKVAMDKKKLFINDLISVANSDGKILDKEIAFIEMLCVVIEIEIPNILDADPERRWGQATVEEEKEVEKNGEHIKYESGISYQGEAKGEEGNRIPHGKGVMTVPDGPVVTGEFKDGFADGHAKMDFLDGEVYEGEFKENKKHGKGIYVWPNGNKYEGEYQKGEKHGHGIFTWSNGKSWVGEWGNDKENGNGVLNYTDGAIYEGYWHQGEINGIEYEQDDGSFEVEKAKYTSSHQFIFEGVFTGPKQGSQRTINGTITTPNGLEINLKDCEKYVDKDLTDAYTSMKNKYGSHTFEYNDTDNGILSFERVSEIFGDCSNEEELSYEMDRVYGLKINNHEGYVILKADDNEIKEALEEERDIESNVIIKSDNRAFVETLVEMLKLDNREDNADQVDILECEKTSNELETEKENYKEITQKMIDSLDDNLQAKEELIQEEIVVVDNKKETPPKEEKMEEARDGKTVEYSEDVYYSEDDLESMWEQIEEWEFFDEPENYGELIIVTVPVDSPPNLNNWQFQLSLTNTIEDKIKFEKRTGLIADKERLPFALENEIVVMVYNEEWRSVTFFSKTKDDEDEEVIKEASVEEVREEVSAKEEVSTKEDVYSIQSFRSFMKEKFPSLKLPKNKPYAGIDLKDGYSINFHVQKKAVVLSFRSVKTDPEEIMRILNEKELNGKDIGDGHILNAEPGKRNPSIITINIEITYSSEDELASDALKENVRSYFEKFSELFDLNK